jgi:hypothetical protein
MPFSKLIAELSNDFQLDCLKISEFLGDHGDHRDHPVLGREHTLLN